MSTRPALPVKLYYRIGEVADLVGVEPHVLRYWEQEFRSIRPQKSPKGQRVYSRKDVEKLLRVKELLYVEQYTIPGARRKLREGEPGEVESDADSELAAMRRELSALRAEITRELEALDREDEPDGG
jgi:DNA-binding transcriptional MerR regulator